MSEERELTVKEVKEAFKKADEEDEQRKDGEYYAAVERSLNVRKGTVTSFMSDQEAWEWFD